MLLALWPLFIARSQPHYAGQDGGATRRAQGTAKRRATAQEAANAHLQRLQEAEHGASIAADSSGALDRGSVPDSIVASGNVAIRIPRHERALTGRLPEALGASLAAGDALQYVALDEAMKAYAAKQVADEDDEMAMIIILSELL